MVGACPECGGSGWVISDRYSEISGGVVSAARRCACSIAPPIMAEALNAVAVADIVGELAQLNFFPIDEDGRLGVCRLVASMAYTLDQVRSLVDQTIRLYNNWPGPHDLRVVFCTLVGRPKDGIQESFSRAVHADGKPVFLDGVIPGTPAAGAAPAWLGPAVVPADRQLREGIKGLIAGNSDLSEPLPEVEEKPARRRYQIPPEERARIEAEIQKALEERERRKAG